LATQTGQIRQDQSSGSWPANRCESCGQVSSSSPSGRTILGRVLSRLRGCALLMVSCLEFSQDAVFFPLAIQLDKREPHQGEGDRSGPFRFSPTIITLALLGPL
jgi:hypothetical protein